MNDPFAWQDEVEEPTATATAIEPAYPDDDPQAIARTVTYAAPSPVSAAVRPEWDARLVIDYVLGVSADAICEAYNLTHLAWERIQLDVGFMGKVAALKKELEKDGATFALKAKLQAEVLLEESFKMAMNRDVDDRVRAKLIGDNNYGRVTVFVNFSDWFAAQNTDYSTTYPKTIAQRLLEIEQIAEVVPVPRLPANEIIGIADFGAGSWGTVLSAMPMVTRPKARHNPEDDYVFGTMAATSIQWQADYSGQSSIAHLTQA